MAKSETILEKFYDWNNLPDSVRDVEEAAHEYVEETGTWKQGNRSFKVTVQVIHGKAPY